MLLIALSQIVYYFGVHLPAYNVEVRLWRDEGDVIYRTADLPRRTQAYLITNDLLYPASFEVLPRFWSVDLALEIVQPEAITAEWFDALPDAPLAFFVAPDDALTIARLQARYRLAGPFASPYNVPDDWQYTLYRTES